MYVMYYGNVMPKLVGWMQLKHRTRRNFLWLTYWGKGLWSATLQLL